MKYKLKKKSKGSLFLHIVESLIYIGIVYSVVKYLGSITPIEPSGIYHFIFVSVLVCFIIFKMSDYWNVSINDIRKLFEKK